MDLDELLADPNAGPMELAPPTEADVDEFLATIPPSDLAPPTTATEPPAITAMCVHNQHLYIAIAGRLFRGALRFRGREEWEEVEAPNG